MQQGPIQYAALLRGINVGGNNIIKMADLKKTFEEMGFGDVRTYIQSGNVLFTAKEEERDRLEKRIEEVLEKKYNYPSKVIIRTGKEIRTVVAQFPKSWSDGSDRKRNVIFLRSPIDSKEILKGLNPKEGIEEVIYRPGVLYWSALVSDLTRSSMIKLASRDIYQEMTVRNSNTTRKLSELMKSYA